MQRLMDRLIDCLPRGAAARDWVVQMALLTVAKESFQVRSKQCAGTGSCRDMNSTETFQNLSNLNLDDTRF